MKRKGTKRKIMVTLMAVMLLMATGVTALAGYDARIQNSVLGELSTSNSKTASARSEGIDLTGGTVHVYLSLTVEYLSSNGNLYCTTPIVKKGVEKVVASKTVTERLVSARSDHGQYSKEFTLIVS